MNSCSLDADIQQMIQFINVYIYDNIEFPNRTIFLYDYATIGIYEIYSEYTILPKYVVLNCDYVIQIFYSQHFRYCWPFFLIAFALFESWFPRFSWWMSFSSAECLNCLNESVLNAILNSISCRNIAAFHTDFSYSLKSEGSPSGGYRLALLFPSDSPISSSNRQRA